ncbi:hypothetical protein AYL99_09760 [Fonsecaea erecta]|uniref:JmjC domain-containing protein n=1 Tax=Fonsecaea erecta TaxID=1367422 RepID=A0A178Z761_9EURO|nr:hypothetical protein AYL99_09760 [Fonsecaea erecta]OAP55609.1 hypothetical protein AYL99_09760 [Fonsecaea erecta]
MSPQVQPLESSSEAQSRLPHPGPEPGRALRKRPQQADSPVQKQKRRRTQTPRPNPPPPRPHRDASLTVLRQTREGIKFFLSLEQMGENLPLNITNLMKNEQCTGLVGIEGSIWAAVDRSVVQPKLEPLGTEGKHVSMMVFVVSSTLAGAVHLVNKRDRRVLPRIQPPSERPSDQACVEVLDKLISKRPDGVGKFYYAGPAEFSSGPVGKLLADLLHPGALKTLPELHGANTPWVYWGTASSATAFHKEDADWGSYNLVLCGWKLWILIRHESNEAFERLIERYSPRGDCNQWLAHNQLLVSPEVLATESIKFDIHVAGSGDLVFTRPRQYHAVVNVTDCLAIAINFCPVGSAPVPKVVACSRCGLYTSGFDGVELMDPERERQQTRLLPAPPKRILKRKRRN